VKRDAPPRVADGSADPSGRQQGRSDADMAFRIEPRDDLHLNDNLLSMRERALAYLKAGIPVHLTGPAGTGKTTLAMDIAGRLERPIVLLSGDGWITSGNLVGRETGARTRQVVDRYVHAVQKIERETSAIWGDDALVQAILGGCTLVYDEFTRSPAAANNPLLSAFEERMLVLPAGSPHGRYVKAHPEFRAILTSNAADYVGVNAPQDALIDRMITFNLDAHDRDTEIGIVAQRCGLEPAKAEAIVDLIRALRDHAALERRLSLRSMILIGRVAAASAMTADASDPRFVQTCIDVVAAKGADGASTAALILDTLAKRMTGQAARPRAARRSLASAA
jgi:nitric oxide reductase NorQ protein